MSGFGYDVLGFGSGAGVAGPVDENFNRVSFLSHFDGANNGVNNAFDDGSASNHTITRNGDVQQGSFGPFAREVGNWSVDFGGGTAPTSLIVTAASSAMDFGTGNFTIEFFGRVASVINNQASITSRSSVSSVANGDFYWAAGSAATKQTYVVFRNGAGTDYLLANSGANYSLDWTHYAVVREGNALSYYVGGTRAETKTVTGSFGKSSAQMFIGRYADENTNWFWNGHMSNLRVVKGTAVYSGSSLVVPTGPLAAITNTTILMLQANRFIDSSTSALGITTTGNAAVSAFGPFLTDAAYDPAVNGASSHLDGNDRLTASSNADFAMGTGVFTVEAWVYQTEFTTNDQVICSMRSSGDSATGILFNIHRESDTTARSNVYISNGINYGASGAIKLNQWNHVAFTRDASNVVRSHVNGIATSHGTKSNNFSETGPFQAGAEVGHYSSNGIKGYLTDLRVLKGTALYGASSFTPPTAPLTAITNTSMLLNMADGQAIDSASQRTLILEGNTKLSTGQAKFGDTSMVFDETNDYAIFPYERFVPFGTSDFTIECFARFAVSTVNNGQGLFQLSNGYLGGNQRGPSVSAYEGGGRWAIYYGAAEAVHASLVPATNTWYHVAYVRSSGTTKLYIDGTQILSVSDTTNYTDTYFTIGGYYTTGYLLNGYIDEFRISRMARYTSNFTAPDEPFPNQGQV